MRCHTGEHFVDRSNRTDSADSQSEAVQLKKRAGGGEREHDADKARRDQRRPGPAKQASTQQGPQQGGAHGTAGAQGNAAAQHGHGGEHAHDHEHGDGEHGDKDGAGEWVADASLMSAMGLEPSPESGDAPAGQQSSGQAGATSEGAAQPAGSGGAAPVQRKGGGDSEGIHQTAAAGLAGSGGSLPHQDAIASSFGKYDVSGISAHTDGPAQQANQSMGSEGYASGNQVAFASSSPSLHTAAHEAAHVFQQQAGVVALKGGVGSVGDVYEQHADAVADRVVQGKSAVDLLDQFTGGGGSGAVQHQAVQHKLVQFDIKADLNTAMDGWGTDEAAIFARIERATPAEVLSVHNDRALLARVMDELEDEPDKDRFYALSARRLYPLDATRAFQMVRGTHQTQRLAILGPVATQRALFDGVIMTTSDAALAREAFHLYWAVEMGLQDKAGTGTLSWPLPTLRLIHDELKKIPDHDTRAGAWTHLTLTNDPNLINRAAYGGGNFLVGSNASTASARVSGYGTQLSAPAALHARSVTVAEPGRFRAGDGICVGLQGDANSENATIRSVRGSTYRLSAPLTKAHPAQTAVGAGDITGSRAVNWLRDTVRHEIGHAVESAIGGVTSFTVGIGGWWTGTDFDTWANQMSSPWHTSNGRAISQADKDAIKAAIIDHMTNQKGTLTALPAAHAVRKHWNQHVPVIVAAERCLSQGDGFFQNPNTLFSSGGKRFAISWWYKRFQYCNDSVVADRLTDYTLYAPAEFFAENYSIFYEDAGRVPDADLGNRIRNAGWRSWIRTNIHNRGHAPAGTGGGGPAGPSAEGDHEEGGGDEHAGTAVASAASFGRASHNPGP
jgi:Domain of unknown function (DUF4157)